MMNDDLKVQFQWHVELSMLDTSTFTLNRTNKTYYSQAKTGQPRKKKSKNYKMKNFCPERDSNPPPVTY